MGASLVHPASGESFRIGSYLTVHHERAMLLEQLIAYLGTDPVRDALTGEPFDPIDYALLPRLPSLFPDDSPASRVARGVGYYVDHSDCDEGWPREQVGLIAETFEALRGDSSQARFWQRCTGPVYVR